MNKTWKTTWQWLCLLGASLALLIGFSWGVTAEETAVVSSGTQIRVTQASGNDRDSIAPSVNSDGTKIVFSSDSDFLSQGIPQGQSEIWLYDTTTATLQRITTASASGRKSTQPSISGDGTKIVFRSDSDFLNQGNSPNELQIWLYDTTTQTFTRVTKSTDPVRVGQRPHISKDGEWIVFDGNVYTQGGTTDQKEIWSYHVSTGDVTRLTTASSSDRFSGFPRTNGDGSKVVFVSDSDFLSQGIPYDQPEIWLLDVGTMALTRITTASDTGRWSLAPDIDDSGDNIVFQSDSDLLGQGIVSDQVEVWHYDVNMTILNRITTADPGLIPIADSIAPRISGNGRYIAFESANDFSGQHQIGTFEIWVYDTYTDNLQRLTTAPNGTTNFNTASHVPDINMTGSAVTFHSSVDFSGGTTQEMPNEVWLHQLSVPNAELIMNYTNGAPGSYFTVEGQNFPANSTATITINGQTMGTTTVDGNGRFLFILTTANADEGTYFVTASVNPTATKQFTLSATEPVRPQEESGDTFDVPAGIAFTDFIYLPIILR